MQKYRTLGLKNCPFWESLKANLKLEAQMLKRCSVCRKMLLSDSKLLNLRPRIYTGKATKTAYLIEHVSQKN